MIVSGDKLSLNVRAAVSRRRLVGVRGLTQIREEREAAAVPHPGLRLGDRLRLVVVGLGISVVPLDTAVNIGFPDITRSFALALPMIQWVVICYVLANAVPMLAFGRVGDMWSHAGVFRLGLLWNGIAFLLCAAAPGFGWLLAARVLQGIGAGLIISCAPALVTGFYPEARRAHALGIFTLMFALGSATGPLIGGVLVARWGWPGVFWFRAPIALGALVLLWRLPASPRAASERFDLAGAVLLASGLAALLLGLNAVPRLADGDYLAVPLLAAAGASFAGFARWEGRAARPIVPVALFRHAGFAAIVGANTAMYLLTFSVMLFAPYYLVRFTDLPLPLAGAVLASGFAAMALASPAAGALIARWRAPPVAVIGALLTGAGLFLVGFWRPGTPPAVLASALLVQGCGLGFFQVASLDVVMASLPPTQRGVAGSLAMLTRTVGVVTGAALLTIAFHAVESAVPGGGAAAFLAAYRTLFRAVGLIAAALAALVAWSARTSG